MYALHSELKLINKDGIIPKRPYSSARTERRTSNPQAGGSNPSGGAIFYRLPSLGVQLQSIRLDLSKKIL